MKRLRIMIEDDAYQTLNVQAAKIPVSKASLVHDCVRRGVQPLPALAEDPLASLSGSSEFEPSGIDETVYGR